MSSCPDTSFLVVHALSWQIRHDTPYVNGEERSKYWEFPDSSSAILSQF